MRATRVATKRPIHVGHVGRADRVPVTVTAAMLRCRRGAGSGNQPLFSACVPISLAYERWFTLPIKPAIIGDNHVRDGTFFSFISRFRRRAPCRLWLSPQSP